MVDIGITKLMKKNPQDIPHRSYDIKQTIQINK